MTMLDHIAPAATGAKQILPLSLPSHQDIHIQIHIKFLFLIYISFH